MKAVFGVVSLLVVLAIVGLLVSRQLTSRPALASAAAAASVSLAASSTVKAQSKQIEDQVMGDVMKAMQQGADADRKEPQ